MKKETKFVFSFDGKKWLPLYRCPKHVSWKLLNHLKRGNEHIHLSYETGNVLYLKRRDDVFRTDGMIL